MRSRYYDGWMDACDELRATLATTCCAQHAIELTKFRLLAMDAGSIAVPALPTATPSTYAQAAAQLLVETATSPDLEEAVLITGWSNTLVTERPAEAVDTITLLALVAAKHYDRR